MGRVRRVQSHRLARFDSRLVAGDDGGRRRRRLTGGRGRRVDGGRRVGLDGLGGGGDGGGRGRGDDVDGLRGVGLRDGLRGHGEGLADPRPGGAGALDGFVARGAGLPLDGLLRRRERMLRGLGADGDLAGHRRRGRLARRIRGRGAVDDRRRSGHGGLQRRAEVGSARLKGLGLVDDPRARLADGLAGAGLDRVHHRLHDGIQRDQSRQGERRHLRRRARDIAGDIGH
ncbi:hypothetical protein CAUPRSCDRAFT_10795 [Caulochytrium protostelioides]|uniref:Uncharacterized protein n=1 Tax=Caulochytrium protostelioides TaxID=1555241 RepID=A0A4P9X0Q7_9FUNG|nr:hypothetical protein CAUPRSCDRAFT_10795 [Caulochytrium protostelioides]